MANLKKLEKLADWLDTRFTIPFTSFRIGLDSIIGLIPGFGDTATTAISLYIFIEAVKMKLPTGILIAMLWNIFVDWFIGLIPFFGDIFDIAWKGNVKNINLIKNYMNDKHKIIDV